MEKSHDVFYSHKNFNNLSKVELDLYLDFLAKVMNNLSEFEVWEAENVISEEDSTQWDNQIIERYVMLLEDKTELENKTHSNL